MSNCACNLLRGIGSFLLGSLRMILFFGCLISVLVQLVVVVMLFNTKYDEDLQLPHTKVAASDAAYAIGLLLLAALGCYGAFYKHHRSIKTFALLSALSASIMIIMILYTMSPDQLQRENERFASRMSRLAKDYTWSTDQYMTNPTQADRAWNKLQKLFCCGLKGPDDWKDVRPDFVQDDLYPSSCCLPKYSTISRFPSEVEKTNKYCDKDEIFQVGCMDRVQQVEALGLTATCFMIAYQLGLCILACIVGNFNFERSSSIDRNVEYGAANRANYQPAEYQRFEGSVYVRQPPVNEQQQHVTKSDLPPLYPNVHEVERTTYLAPPPSYGTGA